MFSKYLNHHIAVKHLFEEYIKNISCVPGYNSGLIKEGVCPICPNWKAVSEHVTGDSGDNLHKSNKILLVKHYSDAHCPVKVQSNATSSSAAKVSSAASSASGPSGPPPPLLL